MSPPQIHHYIHMFQWCHHMSHEMSMSHPLGNQSLKTKILAFINDLKKIQSSFKPPKTSFF